MSTKSIAEKLLIRPNTIIWISDTAQLACIEPLPDGVQLAPELQQANIALVFVESAATAHMILQAHQAHLAKPGILWVFYPKGNKADINRDTLWPILGEYQMRPISQVAIDDVWSALRFRPLKDGEAHFTGGQ